MEGLGKHTHPHKQMQTYEFYARRELKMKNLFFSKYKVHSKSIVTEAVFTNTKMSKE